MNPVTFNYRGYAITFENNSYKIVLFPSMLYLTYDNVTDAIDEIIKSQKHDKS